VTSRSWTVDHAEFPGDSIDRDSGYPDLEVELHPLGVLTAKPTFQLVLKIGDQLTILNHSTAKELEEWLHGRVNR